MKDKKWVVECKTKAETVEVACYIKENTNVYWLWNKYVINHLGDLNSCPEDFNLWSSIPEKCKEYPIYTYEQWKELAFPSKYTIEYCKKNNVVIRVPSVEKWIAVDKLFNTNLGREAGKGFNGEYNWNNYGANSCIYIMGGTYCEEDFFTKNYIIIDFEQLDFEQLNLEKIEQMKKIIGYINPMDLFTETKEKVAKGSLFVKTKHSPLFYGNGADAQTTTYSRHLPKEIVEQWAPQYEEEFKIGDWVTTTTEIAKYYNLYKIGETFKIVKFSNTNAFFDQANGVDINRIRIATEAEINIAKAALAVKIGTYIAEPLSDKGIKFGCQTITKEELLFMKKLLNNEIKASIIVHETKITLGIINKLLNLIK